MGNLFGTLVTIKDFLNNIDMPVEVIVSADQRVTAFTLPKDRKYIIPSYQREIRWEAKELQELIRDVTEGKLFLGNVILSKRENNFEIIDGQQRVTVLRMIITFINRFSTNPNNLPAIDPCELIIDSFSEYPVLHQNNYSLDSLDEQAKQELLASDDYNQCERYIELWELIRKAPELTSNTGKRTFLTHLQECQINLIITDGGNPNLGIGYFVDVNQKGVRLDTEDTLKGYLFQFNADSAKPLWVNIKKECFKTTKELKCNYSLLLLFEQYFYCELYRDSEFERLRFKKEFTLAEDFAFPDKSPSSDNMFKKDTHLIQLLRDHRDLVKDLEQIYAVARLLNVILENEHYTNEFKDKFNQHILEGSDKIGSDALDCIFGLLQKILKDTNEVPKVLAIKYILDVLLNPDLKNDSDSCNRKNIKQKYYSVFSLYTLATLFTMFASKKQKDQIYEAVKGSDWEKQIAKNITKFTRSESVVRNQTTIAYRTFNKAQNEDPRRDAWRCKAMATLYNYLNYDSRNEIYTFNKHNELFKFLNNTDDFSLEHFLLNDCLKCSYIGSPAQEPYIYPSDIKKYVGSMFNFIYISSKINGRILGNRCLPEKIDILGKRGQAYADLDESQKTMIDQHPITCEYSKMVLDILNNGNNGLFSRYRAVCLAQKDKEINNYFCYEFESEYQDFVSEIITRFLEKLKNLSSIQ